MITLPPGPSSSYSSSSSSSSPFLSSPFSSLRLIHPEMMFIFPFSHSVSSLTLFLPVWKEKFKIDA